MPRSLRPSAVEAIALVCSVPLEAEPLRRRLEAPEPLGLPRLSAWAGRLAGKQVVLLVAGMGKTNAARALTALLESRRVRAVLGFGVAGAYPGSGLEVGGLALASAEQYGDEGVETPEGWISCEGIGIPLLEEGQTRLFNTFPVDAPGLIAVAAALRESGRATTVGPFVTVSCCSGTAARGRELEKRFGAVCETMEGAAYAHVAALYDLPFLELRAVSNLVEDRDLSRWRLQAAAETVATALPLALTGWTP